MQELASAGARPAGSPAEVAGLADVVLTSLPDIPAVLQVYLGPEGLLVNSRPGLVLVDHSTVSPEASRTLYEAARKAQADFLDAPVSGGTAGAAAATLTIMVGGDEVPFAVAKPVFEAIGKKYAGDPNMTELLQGLATAEGEEEIVAQLEAMESYIQTTIQPPPEEPQVRNQQ